MGGASGLPSQVARESQVVVEVERECRGDEDAVVTMEAVGAVGVAAATGMMWPTMRCSSAKSRATLTWYSMLQVAMTYSHRENQLNAATQQQH